MSQLTEYVEILNDFCCPKRWNGDVTQIIIAYCISTKLGELQETNKTNQSNRTSQKLSLMTATSSKLFDLTKFLQSHRSKGGVALLMLSKLTFTSAVKLMKFMKAWPPIYLPTYLPFSSFPSWSFSPSISLSTFSLTCSVSGQAWPCESSDNTERPSQCLSPQPGLNLLQPRPRQRDAYLHFNDNTMDSANLT